jgi:RHS repeat-associated protein
MGCIKLEILDKQYRKSELKESSPKNELTFNFFDKNVRKESGNYYYEQRYYNPKKGTFESRDQLFEKYFFMSPYAYCANNPLKYIDPDGRRIRGASVKLCIYVYSNANQRTSNGEMEQINLLGIAKICI